MPIFVGRDFIQAAQAHESDRPADRQKHGLRP
jgi:hypothetical protein